MSLTGVDCYQMLADCTEPNPIILDSPAACCMNSLSYRDGSGNCIECANTGMYICTKYVYVWL